MQIVHGSHESTEEKTLADAVCECEFCFSLILSSGISYINIGLAISW